MLCSTFHFFVHFFESSHIDSSFAEFFIFSAPAEIKKLGVPTGIRTPVPTVKGSCPRPLDDRDLVLVEDSGIEPLTSCMPCKRSPS